MRKIPRTMSTQHPDNATSPFFSSSSVIAGNDEVQEAYYVFSHLNVDEQMWDCEGKEVDSYVVKKLLTGYSNFFSERKLGKDKFLTVRVPNPSIERSEAKFFVETLESIPRSYDVAKIFYGENGAPIFEVILPMTTSFDEIEMISDFYKKYVVGKEDMVVGSNGMRVRDWLGEINPKSIKVIPLVEDKKSILEADKLAEEMIKKLEPSYLRVFIARSDPALNYGHITAALLSKVSLQRLQAIEEKYGINVFPIIGVGSVPFRGHLNPYTFDEFINEYSSCQTFTIQSAFKYDYPVLDVIKAVSKINQTERASQDLIDEKKSEEIMEKATEAYQSKIVKVAKIVRKVSDYVPMRRLRKLHIGLFGYSRSVSGVRLPRAITYCAAMYSIGFPPELIGISDMQKSELEWLKRVYPMFDRDLEEACSYFNPDSLKLLGEEFSDCAKIASKYDKNKAHMSITGDIINSLLEGKDENIYDLIAEAAFIRRFLG